MELLSASIHCKLEEKSEKKKRKKKWPSEHPHSLASCLNCHRLSCNRTTLKKTGLACVVVEVLAGPEYQTCMFGRCFVCLFVCFLGVFVVSCEAEKKKTTYTRQRVVLSSTTHPPEKNKKNVERKKEKEACAAKRGGRRCLLPLANHHTSATACSSLRFRVAICTKCRYFPSKL